MVQSPYPVIGLIPHRCGPFWPPFKTGTFELSNCLESLTGDLGTQIAPGRAMLEQLRITSSLRIQAVRASFLGLPAASSRW